jgi:hypothetical protein
VLAWGMPIRRLREEKREAAVKRFELIQSGRDEKSGVVTTNFNYPGMSLDITKVVLDLTRTMVVTILALILQVVLYVYLYHFGGWQKMLTIISKLSFKV